MPSPRMCSNDLNHFRNKTSHLYLIRRTYKKCSRSFKIKDRVIMCRHIIIKPKFNDVCVLFNTLIFAPEYWKCILCIQIFQKLALASRDFVATLFPSSPTPNLLPSM